MPSLYLYQRVSFIELLLLCPVLNEFHANFRGQSTSVEVHTVDISGSAGHEASAANI